MKSRSLDAYCPREIQGPGKFQWGAIVSRPALLKAFPQCIIRQGSGLTAYAIVATGRRRMGARDRVATGDPPSNARPVRGDRLRGTEGVGGRGSGLNKQLGRPVSHETYFEVNLDCA